MSTRIENTRNLIRQESVQYIRPQTLTLTLIESRPVTKMYVFFNDFDVTHHCYLEGNEKGTPLLTDDLGQAVIKFDIPTGTYNVGLYDVVITDASDLSYLETTGSVYGSAKGNFNANGILEIWQPVSTTVTTRTVRRTVYDPLAQSFFTYGVTGGMFVTSIEVYFQTKDDAIPVRCELRSMVNGYPASYDPSDDFITLLNPADVSISNDASLPSKFVFKRPIYLREDADFCFVLRSNSNNYNVFTSKMGEVSIEDGRKIYEQPYVGSMFKSENAITWEAEQFEDIKFKINKASFDTSAAGYVDLVAHVPHTRATGKHFKTTSGSNIVEYTHEQDHGLEVGSILHITTWDGDAYTGATYNGIPYIEFNDDHTVIEVVDRNTVKFQVTTPATSSGNITHSNVLSYIKVVSGGINYSPSDTINIIGGGSGATASMVVEDGVIKNVTITNGGSGYSSLPTITVTSLSGVGAQLVPSIDPTFTVLVNKPMTGYIPRIEYDSYTDTSLNATLLTTIGNYENGNLVTYNSGRSFPINMDENILNIEQNSLIASSHNEMLHMAGNYSTIVRVEMSTTNKNVSPLVYLDNGPSLDVYYNKINNQSGESLTSTNSSGSVDNIVVTAAGSGYTLVPTIAIDPPQLDDGVQATATVVLSGNTIASITIDEAGSGYTKTPIAIITPAAGDTTGTGGAAQVQLTPFNTELLPVGGNAASKYIAKKTQVQLVSSGVRIFSYINSGIHSSVDWYIRTSLSNSGVDHDKLEWIRLNCDVPRNKTDKLNEFYEYQFYLDDVPEFDTYDLKCVMLSNNPIYIPIIKNYRVIVIA